MNTIFISVSLVLIIGLAISFFYLSGLKITGSQIIEPSIVSSPIIPSSDSEFSYSLKIGYSKGELNLVELNFIEGSGPDRLIQPETGYTAKIVTFGGEAIHGFKFDIPLLVYSNGVIELDETEFGLRVPYFENAREITIYDTNGQLKLSLDVSGFSRALFAHFPFDSSTITGSVVQDSSGNNNRGILKDGGLPTVIDNAYLKIADPGKIGQALIFDGLDDSVTVSHNPTLGFEDSSSITLSAWVYLTGRDGYEFKAIMAKRPAIYGNPRPYSLNLDRENKKAQFVLATGSDINKYAAVVSTAEIPLNQWILLTGTWDGNQMKLYVDGRLDNQFPFSGIIQPGTDPAGVNQPKPLAIGSGEDLEANFKGQIDDARIYNYALNDKEVTRLFHQALSVKEFLGAKSLYEGLPANILGVVKYKYTCPVCATGMLCPLAPCFNAKYITLADYPDDSPENEIIINFLKDDQVYQDLQVGQAIVVNANYYSTKLTDGMANTNGYFEYNSLTKLQPAPLVPLTGIISPSPSPLPCQPNVLIPPACVCGTTPIYSGYCCNGMPSAFGCSSAISTLTPPCQNGQLVPPSCMCGTVIISSGWCCSTATGYQNLAAGC